MASGTGPGGGIGPEGHYHHDHQVNHGLPFEHHCDRDHAHQRSPYSIDTPYCIHDLDRGPGQTCPGLVPSKGHGGCSLARDKRGVPPCLAHPNWCICAMYLVDVWCGKIPNAGFGVIVDQGGNTIQPKVVWEETVIVWVMVQVDLSLE
jgi:hypothetical protein